MPRIRWAQLIILALVPFWWRLGASLAPVLVLMAWLVFCLAWFMAWEHATPYRMDWRTDKRHLRHDGAMLSLNVVVDGIVSVLIALTAIHASSGDSRMALPLQIPLGIVLAEFGSYWLHRASHGEGWMWHVHVLHHRPERVNTANALTAHPLNAVWDKLARMLPLHALGLHADAIVWITLFTLAQSLAAHANIRGGLGWLDYMIGGPILHRLHHSTRHEQAGNFGTTIPLWDYVFGTFRRPEATETVGVFDSSRYPGELQTLQLLCYPLKCIWPCGNKHSRTCCRANRH